MFLISALRYWSLRAQSCKSDRNW